MRRATEDLRRYRRDHPVVPNAPAASPEPPPAPPSEPEAPSPEPEVSQEEPTRHAAPAPAGAAPRRVRFVDARSPSPHAATNLLDTPEPIEDIEYERPKSPA